jgi:hypothetical protein
MHNVSSIQRSILLTHYYWSLDYDHLVRLELSVPDPLDLDILRHFSSEVGVGRLHALEDPDDLASVCVALGHAQRDVSCGRRGVLDVLLDELFLVSSASGGESDGVVVSRGATTALGVEEGRATVAWHEEGAAEALRLAGGDELLDGEEERHALTSRELHRDCSVVDAVLLLKLEGAVGGDLERTLDLVKGVGKAGHELGLLELGWGVLGDALGLDREGRWLQAQLLHVVFAGLEGEGVDAAVDGWALVRSAGPLHLHVRLALDLVVGQPLGSTLCTRALHRETSTYVIISITSAASSRSCFACYIHTYIHIYNKANTCVPRQEEPKWRARSQQAWRRGRTYS